MDTRSVYWVGGGGGVEGEREVLSEREVIVGRTSRRPSFLSLRSFFPLLFYPVNAPVNAENVRSISDDVSFFSQEISHTGRLYHVLK